MAEEKKKSTLWFIVLSVLYVVTGIMILIWPNLTNDLLGKALGIGMLVVGITMIIIYFTKDHMGNIMEMELTRGVVFAAFGAFMLMHADFIEVALPFGMGILLMIGAISKIQYSLDMKRLRFIRWKLLLIFALILLAMGIILIYNPFKNTFLFYYIAIALIVDGTLNIICVLSISHRMKQISRGRFPMEVMQHRPGGHDVVIDHEQGTAAVSDADPAGTAVAAGHPETFDAPEVR